MRGKQIVNLVQNHRLAILMMATFPTWGLFLVSFYSPSHNALVEICLLLPLGFISLLIRPADINGTTLILVVVGLLVGLIVEYILKIKMWGTAFISVLILLNSCGVMFYVYTLILRD